MFSFSHVDESHQVGFILVDFSVVRCKKIIVDLNTVFNGSEVGFHELSHVEQIHSGVAGIGQFLV